MKLYLYACLILIQITGCTPLPTFILDPAEDNSVWLNGRQIMTKSIDGIDVAVSFSETEDVYLVLDLEIKNRSAETVLVEPEKFYYRSFAAIKYHYRGQKLPRDTVKETRYPTYALNPETQLLQLDRQIAHEKADRETSEGLDLFIDIVDLAADIATIDEPKTDEEIREEDEADFERDMTRKAEAAEYRETIRDLGDYRKYWSTITLRKTTLAPNQSVKGKVYFVAKPFPPVKRMKMMRMCFPIGNRSFDFLFNRTKHTW